MRRLAYPTSLMAAVVPVLLGSGAAATLAEDVVTEAPPPEVALEAPPESGVTSIEVAPSGHVRKVFGEPAGLTVVGSSRAYFEITIEDVRPTTSCPGRGVSVAPEHGYFLVVELTASVSEDVSSAVAGGENLYMPLTADAFDLASGDGPIETQTSTDASWACFEDADLAPPFVGAGESVGGIVVLDSHLDTGTLVYAPGGAGWEWEFGR